MSNANRIQPLGINPDVARQTPKNEFGEVLVQTLKAGASASAGIVGAMVPGMPVLSAAVSGIQNMLSVGSVQTSGTAASVAAPVTGLGAVGTGGSAAGSPLGNIQGASTGELLQSLASNPDGSSAAYLELQMRMAQESQQFTSLSNVLKVRADSAKAAINNIR